MDIKGEWKGYINSRMDSDYTLTFEDFDERKRVKFYRAKNIFNNIVEEYNSFNGLEFHTFFLGFVSGAKYDRETVQFLAFFRKENGF